MNHYYIEELNESLECIDLSVYSVVIIIDAEKDFTTSELELLRYFHEEMYLSLFIISEWNKGFLKEAIQFNDIELQVSNNPSTWYTSIIKRIRNTQPKSIFKILRNRNWRG